jgi:hypothetical protein
VSGEKKLVVVLPIQVVVNPKIMSKKEHWENVFATKQEKEVSWYQQNPETSLDFFKDNAISKDAKIIDIGGGDSYLIDSLLEMGYTNLYLLDISENAIKRIQKRLGKKANQVTFIVSDVLDYKPELKFDVWHDRASFHFLTAPEDVADYRTIVTNSLNDKGYFFLGTFSENGPLKCSGLEISQYSEAKFKSVFANDFDLQKSFTQDHQTPFNTVQNFIFCTFQKK